MSESLRNCHTWKSENIKPSLLKVDTNYQRPVDNKRIKKILDDWNYDLVRPPIVSRRADGSYYVVDGQHTKVAWGIHENNAPIACKVCYDLTYDEEVQLYLLQFGYSAPIGLWDRSRAKFNRGDTEEVIMVETVKAAGLEVVFSSNRGRNKINALGACYDGINRIGAYDFADALSILREAWDGDFNGLKGTFINGIVELYATNKGKFKRERLIEVLGKKKPKHFESLASTYPRGMSSGKKYAAAFREEYNKNARKNVLTAS